jgi:hypothetical protein
MSDYPAWIKNAKLAAKAELLRLDFLATMGIISYVPSPAPSNGVYSADPLACSGCVSGCFRCAPDHVEEARKVVSVPLETQQYNLKAMAKNYADGHRWDHLDSEACIKAANEIAELRALLAGGDQ